VTKGEIVALLPAVTTQEGAAQLAKAVAALDLCTAAERELIELVACLATDEIPTPSQVEAYKRAHAAIRAERTPPDPVEAFIAEVRESTTLTGPSFSCAAVERALAKLDAARGKR
jgi:hypothetical protein